MVVVVLSAAGQLLRRNHVCPANNISGLTPTISRANRSRKSQSCLDIEPHPLSRSPTGVCRFARSFAAATAPAPLPAISTTDMTPPSTTPPLPPPSPPHHRLSSIPTSSNPTTNHEQPSKPDGCPWRLAAEPKSIRGMLSVDCGSLRSRRRLLVRGNNACGAGPGVRRDEQRGGHGGAGGEVRPRELSTAAAAR